MRGDMPCSPLLCFNGLDRGVVLAILFLILNLGLMFELGECCSISVIKAKSTTHETSVINVSNGNGNKVSEVQ
jgi:hypothetical protein